MCQKFQIWKEHFPANRQISKQVFIECENDFQSKLEASGIIKYVENLHALFGAQMILTQFNEKLVFQFTENLFNDKLFSIDFTDDEN